MAQVPYQPFPTAQPQGGGEQISVPTPGAAFGENIGQAVSRLGGTLEQGGGEIFQRAIALQELANETEAREKDAGFAKEQGILHADFLMNRGAAARAALPKFLADSDALRQKYRNSLSNPAAQRMFDASSLGFMVRNINSASIHAGEQFQQYVGNEAAASRARAESQYIDPDDPGEYSAKTSQANKDVDTQADVDGWGPERRAAEKEKSVQNINANRISSIADKGEVGRAWSLLQQAQTDKTISAKGADALQKHIWNENEKRASKVYIDKIFDPDKSDADMAREVEQMANDPRITLGDPEFPIYMRHALEARIREANGQSRLQKGNDLNMIQRLVNGGANDYASVDASPEGHAALASLERNNPKEFNSIKKDISTWAGKRDFETSEHSKNVLQTLYRDDPNKYLQIDLFDPSLKLDRKDRDFELNRRDRLLKENGTSIKDPVVENGITYIQKAFPTQMYDAGLIDKHGRQVRGTDKWNSFWGYVDTSIRNFQQQNKKQPGIDDLNEIAREAWITHGEPGFWSHFGGPLSKVQEFQRKWTTDEMNAGRKELRDADPAGREPDDQLVQRWLRQKQWNDFHQGGKKEETGAPTGPTAPTR